MKKILMLFFLFTSCTLAAWTQNMTAIFDKIPDDIIYGLTAEQKIRLTSNLHDPAVVITDNSLYENLKRTAASEDYIAISTSATGSVQIKLLPLINDSKIICVVKTVCKNICDSQIYFYTTKWVRIDKNNLMPSIQDSWFINTGGNDSEDLQQAISATDINPVKLTLSAEDYTLNAELDIENYLDKENYDVLKPFLTNPKTLTWDKASFK